MADVITFNCSGCSTPYRVAISYAGRDFACKSCGQRQTVPQAESEVELGSGSQVIRRTTTSGRQVSVDPTRVFTRERETSARLAAVAPQSEAAKSSKGALIAVVAVIVLLVGGLGAAALLGAFSGDDADAGQVSQSNTPAGPANEESARSRILKQVDVPGLGAAEFMNLLKQAEEAKLETADLTMIARVTVSAIIAESGAGLSDADLMAFAARVQKLNLPADADSLYSLIIERGRAASQKSAEFKQAHEKLGHAWVDISPQIERAVGLQDSGVIEGMETVQSELIAIEKGSDQGWLLAGDKQRFDEIVTKLEAAQSEYDRITRDEPFLIKAAAALRLFKLEKASTLGKWVTLTREPFVFFVQLHGGEDKAGAESRLESALEAAEQFQAFYRNQLVEPLQLKRMLPTGLSEAEREQAPFVLKLFRDASYLKPHLADLGVHMDVTLGTTFTEPGTGHVSMAYANHEDSFQTYRSALVGMVMYNYHPGAPTTKAEDDKFRSYSSAILNDFFHASIAQVSLDKSGNIIEGFLQVDTRSPRLLSRWRQPFAKAANGSINSLGGQVLTVKDFASAKSTDDVRAAAKAKLETLEGWSEGDLMAATTANSLSMISREYYRALFQFLYHWGPDGPKYRDQLMKFVRMDLAGEVKQDDPLPAFTKAFGLNDAGWKQLEADFTAYQS